MGVRWPKFDGEEESENDGGLYFEEYCGRRWVEFGGGEKGNSFWI